VLKPANPPTQIDEVAINYLSKNVAPVVDEVVVQVGARFLPQPKMTGPETIAINWGAATQFATVIWKIRDGQQRSRLPLPSVGRARRERRQSGLFRFTTRCDKRTRLESF